MEKRKGYVLLSLLLFFTVLVLSSTVTVLQHDTRLKRFSEEDLKHNVDAIRRGIDLFRYKFPDPSISPRKELENFIASATSPAATPQVIASSVASITLLLTEESFIRARIATDTMRWKMIRNLINNPSFEDDSGQATYPPTSSGWRGNFSAGDGAPDGWKLTDLGAEQYVDLGPATYVVSFWARGETPTSEAKLRVYHDVSPLEITAKEQEWKRYYASFKLFAPKEVRIEIVRSSAIANDVTYIDGIMLEKWDPPVSEDPNDTPPSPSPSAFTRTINLIPARADKALKKNVFHDLVPDTASPDSISRWFNW